MSDKEKIVLKAWKKTAHRSPTAITTINLAASVHARFQLIRAKTGLTYNEIARMALDELEKKIVVEPSAGGDA